jgi:UDP-N-acetylmuramyl-tripeptide synthetase
MKLDGILQNIKIIEKMNISADLEITGISQNSNEISAGNLFVALRGGVNDGNNYVNDALAKGAAAILTDARPSGSVPYILVEDARKAVGLAAGNFYGNKHREMKIIAVIGTNGKTTTAHMIGAVLTAAGRRAAVIGTLGASIVNKKIETDMTTPDPIIFHKLIRESWEAGVTHFVYELSAHAIYWKKSEGVPADIAVFTNFSQDHLDFFKTMENYRAVKKSYFTRENVRFAIVNADDPLGLEIAREGNVLATTYGLHNPSDSFAMDIEYDGTGSSALVNCCDDIFEIKTNFLGEFNMYNALAALTAARAMSVDPETIRKGFRIMKPVSGRFNIYESTKRVVVDFAHTPDGLRNLLTAARGICGGKLIAVFGCGGNRDAKKRSVMGKIAGELADFTVLTSDNSRDEEPDNIISQIEQGLRGVSKNYIKIAERESAITYAILTAKPDDLIVIAGKGGEEYMEERGIKRPYSDKKVVEEVFRRYNV